MNPSTSQPTPASSSARANTSTSTATGSLNAFIDPEQSMRNDTIGIGAGCVRPGPKDVALVRCGDELCQPAAVDVAGVVAALPSVVVWFGEHLREPQAERSCAHGAGLDRPVDALTVFAQLSRSHQRRQAPCLVVVPAEHPVAGGLVAQRPASTGRRNGGRVVVGFGVEKPFEGVPSGILFTRLGLQVRQVCDALRDGAGEHSECSLGVPVSAQEREFAADGRCQFEPGPFDQVLCPVGDRLRGDPGAADLRDGVQQQPGVGLDRAAMPRTRRPFAESLGEVATHAGPRRQGPGTPPGTVRASRRPGGSPSPSGSSSACTSGSLCRNRSAIPSAAPRPVGGCRCGTGIRTDRPPRYRVVPRKCRSCWRLKARIEAARSSRMRCSRRIAACSVIRRRPRVSSSSRSKQRWKYSATIGRSASSHLLTNDSRKATPTSPKIARFSAHVITVRGDIRVERSPTRKPLRVRFATATIEAMTSRSTSGTFDATMSASTCGGKVIERCDDVPPVDLRVVESLHAVVEPVEVAEPDGVRGGEEPEQRVR